MQLTKVDGMKPQGRAWYPSLDELLSPILQVVQRKEDASGTLYAKAKDNYRKKENIEEMYGVVLDIDKSPTDVLPMLVEALQGYQGYINTTFSHDPRHEKYCYRAFIKSESTIKPEDYEDGFINLVHSNPILSELKEKGILDMSAKDVGRFFYDFSCPPSRENDAYFHALEGMPLIPDTHKRENTEYSSEDYLNEWYNTRAWGILSLRRFRESIDTSINEIQDHEIIEAVRVYDSLRNLQTPNGTTPKDIQTLLKFKKSMIEKGMPERIPPELHSFLNHAEEEIIKGKSPDVAYKYKGEVSGGSGLDETNPPKYIFQITDGLLNSDGASLHKVSKVVEINEYQVTKLTAQQMRKQFREKEMWRLQGYVNWRMEKQIKNKTNDIKWTKGQIKNLKRYWGIEVK